MQGIGANGSNSIQYKYKSRLSIAMNGICFVLDNNI